MPRPSSRPATPRRVRARTARVLVGLVTGGSVVVTGATAASATAWPSAAVGSHVRVPAAAARAGVPAAAGSHLRVAPAPGSVAGYLPGAVGGVAGGTSSRAASQTERQRVTVEAPTAARTGSTVTLTGTVSPARSGLKVSVQRRYGGRWHALTSTRLAANGTWAAAIRTPASRGWLRYRVVAAKNGRLPARAAEAARIDNYTRHTYVVRKRGAVTASMKEFARQAAQTYADTRGWRAAHHRFARVATGGSFTLVLAEAKYLPSYSSVCSVRYSCRAGRYVVINQNRWRRGSTPFTGSLRNYRHMVVNHETGHWLGFNHYYCGGAGQTAPIMQQQSISLQGCRANPWPTAVELARLPSMTHH